jgi:hypothetical protein
LLTVVDKGGASYEKCEAGCQCRGPADGSRFSNWDERGDRVSFFTMDTEYAFLFAYYDGTHGTTLALGSGCSAAGRGFQRIGPSWVISGARVPARGEWDSGVFRNHKAFKEMPAPTACGPTRSSFVAWTRGLFPFGPEANVRLEAIVSDKYANAGDAHPGAARQVERTYWTREFGITRWEKWDRADLERRDGMDVAEKARTIYRQGVCGRPYGPPARVTANLRYAGVVEVDGLYKREQVHQDAAGKPVRNTWYMVDCSDWTRYGSQDPMDLQRVWMSPPVRQVLDALR